MFEPVEKTLKCTLSDEELIDRSRKLAHHMAEVSAAEGELASFKSVIKSRVAQNEAKVQQYRQAVAEGAEWRPIRCKQVPDFEQKVVEVVRPDTGEVVEVRGMRNEEAQTEFEGMDPEVPGDIVATLQWATEQKVKDAAKFYEAREVAKRLLGDGYGQRLSPLQECIKQRREETGDSALSVAIGLATKLADEGMDNGMELLLIFAAAVELTEGTDYTVDAENEDAEQGEE